MLESQKVRELLQDYATTNSKVAVIPENGILYEKDHNKKIVPILSGGGSGHEPAHFGYVASGMLTAAVTGEVFAPPKSEDILKAIEMLDEGLGVFIIIKNFEADLKNFRQAIEKAKKKGIKIAYIVSHDDISVDVTKNYAVRHRGVVGTVLLHKILGEAARRGASLKELETLALELSVSIFTIGATKSPVTLPGEKMPIFELPKGYVSLGIGIHGEAGYRKEPFISLEYLANELINKLKLRCHFYPGEKYIVLVNNLGGFSKEDQQLFTNAARELLALEDLEIVFLKSQQLMSSLNMEGISLTLCKLKEDYWLDYLNAPVDTPFW